MPPPVSQDDLSRHLATLRSGECIPERCLKRLCSHIQMLLIEENNVEPVSSPVTVVGDLHGQFFDFLNLLSDEVGGSPPNTSYVFLGDFVDRGHYSVETLSLLFVLKAMHPECVTLLRGNHESRQITQVYGFYDECLRKYGNASAWRHCVATFDCFSLAATIDNTVLCVHGGLSPDIRTLDQIRIIDRQQEVPHDGPFCDLVWSDPEDIVDPWQVSPRGAGFLFGEKVTNEFNQINGLNLIARAHQLVMEGKKFHFSRKNLVTVWSAPNYCYRCGNVASILQINRTVGPEGGMNVGEEHFLDRSVHADSRGSNNSNGNDKNPAIEFKYFSETNASVHGPKGEERAQLVPYFL